MSPPGKVLKNLIIDIPKYHPRIILDEWVIMPDHIHLLLGLGDYNYVNNFYRNHGLHIGNVTNKINVINKQNNINEIKGMGVDVGIDVDVEKIHEFSLHQYPHQYLHPHSDISQNNIAPDNISQNNKTDYRKIRRQMLIPKIIGKFKMLSAKQIHEKSNEITDKIWQPNYYDEILHTENEIEKVRFYIQNNPVNYE